MILNAIMRQVEWNGLMKSLGYTNLRVQIQANILEWFAGGVILAG
jgi:hypothetical protein